MSETGETTTVTTILRVVAAIGTLTITLIKIFFAPPLQPLQYFSFYVLGFTALAFLVMLFGLVPRAARWIVKEPDVLVPLGLYITISGVFDFLAQRFAFATTVTGFADFSRITILIAIGWVVRFAISVCFIGWTTRTLVNVARSGRAELLSALLGADRWFPRAAIAIVVSWVPGFVLLGLIAVPVLLSQAPLTSVPIMIPFILLLLTLSLLWNLTTAVLLPFMLSTKVGFRQSIREGIRLSWLQRNRTILPITLVMLLSGALVFLSIHYTETSESSKESDDGTYSTTSTVTTNYKWAVKGQFTSVAKYPESSNWNNQLMTMVGKESLPSVDFRLLLLLLLFSVAANLQIILRVTTPEADGKEQEREQEQELEVDADENHPNLLPGLAIFSVLLILIIPFEYIVKGRGPLSSVAAKDNQLELVVPKVYVGEGVLARRTLFRNAKSDAEKNVPVLVAVSRNNVPGEPRPTPDPDERELNNIIQVFAGEVDEDPGVDILAAGNRQAFILSPDGQVKKTIDYGLGRYLSGGIWQDRNLVNIEIVDFDHDGHPDIAGEGNGVCQIIDLTGKVLWKYQGKRDDDLWMIRTLTVGDIDRDGSDEVLIVTNNSLEVYAHRGPLRWKQDGDFGFDLAVADFDGDGTNEVVAGRSIFDRQGKFIKEMKRPIRVNGFLTEAGEPFETLLFDQNKLILYRFERLAHKYDAPLSYVPDPDKDDQVFGFGTLAFRARARYVQFRRDGEKFLAVLADTSDPHYSYFDMLYIYNSEGRLIYHETIRAFQSRPAILPEANGDESLLLTDDGKLLKYSLN